MKKLTITGLLALILALFTISGCGGSGGDDDTTVPPPVQPTTAEVKLISQGAGMIHGIDVTVELPAGVTVKATPDATNPSVMVTDTGVVTASGAAAANTNTIATYEATPSGVVDIHLANAAGFAPGEFVTIVCDIAVGSFPVATDFNVTGFSAVDGNGVAIVGMTADHTADIQ